MAGIKGAGGPPPKRSDQRRHRNKPAKKITEVEAAETVDRLDADPDWHPIAIRWYDGLAKSGQSVFYETTDYDAAYVIAESMSREFKPQPLVVNGEVHMVEMPPKAASVAAWLKGFTGLLVTEGDRRRASLELVRSKPDSEEADVSELSDYRRRLQSG